MADYYNAREILPADLLRGVLEHVPEGSRSGALVYFSEDYYGRRNAEIVRCFHIYQADPHFGSRSEIYEALSEQYGLTARRICKIVKENGDHRESRPRARRRLSGIRVDRCSRRMKVRTAAP